jgi:hypothetical protein
MTAQNHSISLAILSIFLAFGWNLYAFKQQLLTGFSHHKIYDERTQLVLDFAAAQIRAAQGELFRRGFLALDASSHNKVSPPCVLAHSR